MPIRSSHDLPPRLHLCDLSSYPAVKKMPQATPSRLSTSVIDCSTFFHFLFRTYYITLTNTLTNTPQATLSWLSTFDMDGRLLGQLAGLRERVVDIVRTGLFAGGRMGQGWVQWGTQRALTALLAVVAWCHHCAFNLWHLHAPPPYTAVLGHAVIPALAALPASRSSFWEGRGS